MPELEVLCVGSATLDTIALADDFPREDSRSSTSIMVAGGGPAATAAVTLARLGVAVGFCGVVGADDAGRQVQDDLEAEGVDTRWLVRGERTGASVVVVSARTGSRTILAQSPAPPLPEHVPAGVARWYHVDQIGYAPVCASPPVGALLSIDGGNDIPSLDLSGVALYAPTLAALGASAHDALDALARVRAEGVGVVVATDGERGSWLADDDGTRLVPAFTADVVSTLGAGDVFHGALLAGIVRGLETEESVRVANATAAIACTALDGRSAIPRTADLDTFLARTTSNPGSLG